MKLFHVSPIFCPKHGTAQRGAYRDFWNLTAHWSPGDKPILLKMQ